MIQGLLLVWPEGFSLCLQIFDCENLAMVVFEDMQDCSLLNSLIVG